MQMTTSRRLSRVAGGSALLALTLTLLVGCKPASDSGSGAKAPPLKTPKLAINLPEEHNTPDGMTLDKEGNIILSVPNFGNPEHPAALLKIDQNDKFTKLVELPLHPTTKRACPLGVDFAADGNLYVADAQPLGGATDPRLSRLIRVTMQDGKAVKCDVVVEGFNFSNAVAGHGDSVYVTETKLVEAAVQPHLSGVYKFKLSEFTGAPIQLQPDGADPHLILKLETANETDPVGANGMAFDKAGNMYVCNFGEASIVKCTMTPDGMVESHKVLVKGQGMKCTDGMTVAEDGMIYVADFLGNAVHRVDPNTGKVTTLAKNGQTDGKGGLLDAPSEVRVRGKRCYAANIDLTYGPNTSDAPHTISVIELD